MIYLLTSLDEIDPSTNIALGSNFHLVLNYAWSSVYVFC
jgi:hypothetical protein